MKIIANKIGTFHDISQSIRFCTTASGNSLTTRYDHRNLNINARNSIPKMKTSILLIFSTEFHPNISFQSYYKYIII